MNDEGIWQVTKAILCFFKLSGMQVNCGSKV